MNRQNYDGERFWSHVDLPDNPNDCWGWSGERNYKGYGIYVLAESKNVSHRFLYELLNGTIPVGYECHHVCENTSCVNPEHIEIVTHQQNIRYWADTITHCPKGHEYNDENTGYYKRSNGVSYKYCKICNRAKVKRLQRASEVSNEQ